MGGGRGGVGGVVGGGVVVGVKMRDTESVVGRFVIESVVGQEVRIRVEARTKRGRVLCFDSLRMVVGDSMRVTFPEEPRGRKRR